MAAKPYTVESSLVVIAGPTASGKTSLAIKLAQQYGGEIICADSRTVYTGMDIGTAKPTPQEQATVPHWGIDLVKPGDAFSVADFKAYSLEKIADIRSRGKVPFLVGGSGLYIDAVIFDYEFGPKANNELRQRLEGLNTDELVKYCIKHSIKPPKDIANKRRILRAIELLNINPKRRNQPIDSSIVVGIATDRDELRTRIESRSEQFFLNNVVEEATKLSKMYGWDSEAMTGNIYPIVRKFLEGSIDEAQLRQKFMTSDWRLVKRQLTWLRSNEHICWADLASAEHYISAALASRVSL